MKISIAVLAVAAAAFAASAEAKTWQQGSYTCEDERQAASRLGMPAGTVTVIGVDNVGQCLGKCGANPKCRTVNIRHVNPTPNDATTCTLYVTKTVRKIVFKTILNKQWGAVCSKP